MNPQAFIDIGDHTHSVTIDDGTPVRTADFDFGALDPEIQSRSLIPIDMVTSSFVRILEWAQSAENLTGVGARIASLQVLLDPVNGKYKSLSEVARASGFGRATLSKALVNLRDAYGLQLSLYSGRENCRAAQLSALERGTHSSFCSHKNGAKAAPQTRETMDQKVKERFRTLDAATDEIARLEGELSKQGSPKTVASPQKPQNQPAVVKPVVTATAMPAPPTAPRQLKASDLSMAELKEALDLANRDGDTEMVRLLYSELNSRRKR